MSYTLKFAKRTKKQLDLIKKNKAIHLRYRQIIEDIKEDPYSPAFKFERLKGDLRGLCSKRLSLKDRIVYRVVNEKVIIEIISLLDHY